METLEKTLRRALKERDLLLQLIELGEQADVSNFLKQALALLIEVASARRGYIELRDPTLGREEPTFSMVSGMDDSALSSDAFSRSVIAESFATGETVVTASAKLDPRFETSGSVQAQRLEAVLCVPWGESPVLGVVYLQDRVVPGPFSAEDRAQAELFAKQVGRLADRILWQQRQRVERDATQGARSKLKLQGIIGTSDALARALQQISVVAPLQVGVLLTGESGTGKTLFARAIHENSARRERPFLELNCAALPDDLLENELFGSAAGAHSTAQRRLGGKLEAAEGGTLFLDEVGELSLRAQAKLLQLLQSGVYYPLGDATPRKANIRIIAATNADLRAAVAAKAFREDLFYRLSVFPIQVPSLAERRSDLLALSTHFCRVACEVNGILAVELSPGAITALEHADWPGNVRELAHVVQAGVLRAYGEGAHRVERRHVFPLPTDVLGESAPQLTFDQATRGFQAQLLRETLERESWNVAAAARSLDLTRTHIYNLLKSFGISRPESADGA